jgi:FlaA1/EpsC-like NDP-sugar epimerase
MNHGKRVLIFGAGDAGEIIVRDMKHDPYYGYSPIGFIDDDPLKMERRIHGVRVLGDRGNLPQIVTDHRPDEILIAICRAEPRVLRDIVRSLEPYKLPIKRLPSLRDMINGTLTVSQIRNVSLEDLLQRGPVGLDPGPLHRLIEGRRILVTGAGGSIGSELCRQLATLNVGLLLMLERYENALYTIDSELRDSGTKSEIVPLIADVTDAARVRRVFEQYRPELVFHAAAHKHVPLVQLNVCEALKNNIRGTRITAETAVHYGADRFIMISTDKAVQPSSVMGATKRAAEFLVRRLSLQTSTRFGIVRFGNVLGSNGSVIPKFLDQIRAGGPVTVTHPEVERFFMTIPEAVNLVLHAATLDETGAIYALDMGPPIKILDMARHLIRLSVPDQDIRIEFTGLRPGEKLRERLYDETETLEQSVIPQIFKVIAPSLHSVDRLCRDLIRIEALASRGEQGKVLAELTRIVPGFSLPTTVPKEAGLATGFDSISS